MHTVKNNSTIKILKDFNSTKKPGDCASSLSTIETLQHRFVPGKHYARRCAGVNAPFSSQSSTWARPVHNPCRGSVKTSLPYCLGDDFD